MICRERLTDRVGDWIDEWDCEYAIAPSGGCSRCPYLVTVQELTEEEQQRLKKIRRRLEDVLRKHPEAIFMAIRGIAKEWPMARDLLS